MSFWQKLFGGKTGGELSRKASEARISIPCPRCAEAVRETTGSPISPYINVYHCGSCGWRKLRCGDRSCDGYMEGQLQSSGRVVTYRCVKCRWSGDGDAPVFGEEGTRRTEAPSSSQPTRVRTVADLELVLQGLERKLKSSATNRLPVVKLGVREILGKRQICWHFATGYGVALDVSQAQAFLVKELGPYGVTVSGGDYMGDREGNRHNLWDFSLSS